MSSITKVWWLLAALMLTSAALIAGETIPLSSQLPQGDPDDVYWDNSLAYFGGGPSLNGSVSGLTVYGGKLIVTGNFTTAGGIAANHIASWDGLSWSALGSGINNSGPALIVYHG